MGPCAWVDHNAGATAAGSVDPVDQFAFVVGLAEFNLQAQIAGAGPAAISEVAKRFATVLVRLAGAEQIEIGAVEHENAGRHWQITVLLLGAPMFVLSG